MSLTLKTGLSVKAGQDGITKIANVLSCCDALRTNRSHSKALLRAPSYCSTHLLPVAVRALLEASASASTKAAKAAIEANALGRKSE